jgi:hypothetical protein
VTALPRAKRLAGAKRVLKRIPLQTLQFTVKNARQKTRLFEALVKVTIARQRQFGMTASIIQK